MTKTLGTDYKSKLWDGTLDAIQKLIKTELDIYPTYVSPVYKETGNLGIRIWPTSISHEERYGPDTWSRLETFEIVLYSKSQKADDVMYEQLFNDFDNIWQLMFDNLNYPASATKSNWMDGKIENVTFNELTDDEIEITGLHSIVMDFSCITKQQI